MARLLLHLVVFLLLLNNQAKQLSKESCCETKTVTGAGLLDGEYMLNDNLDTKPDPVCLNGCIYTKNGEPENEYCFKSSQYVKTSCVSNPSSTNIPTMMIKTEKPQSQILEEVLEALEALQTEMSWLDQEKVELENLVEALV